MSALWILAVALVAVGIAGVVVPGIPGTPLVFAGLVAAAWADGFQKVGFFTLFVLGLLTALSFVVDLASAGLGAKRVGASKWAVVGSALGALVGLFMGIPGLLVGPFLGAVAGELLVRRDWRQAGRAGLGAWLGFLFGSLAKLALSFAMVAIFVVAYLL